MSNTEAIVEILLEDVLYFHEYLEQFFVMRHGIHNQGLLESAINAPFQSYGGIPLFSGIFDQAARLCYGLAKNHPFLDGNKRIAVHSMLVFLAINHIRIKYTDDEMETVVLDIVMDKMSCEDLAIWLRTRSEQINE